MPEPIASADGFVASQFNNVNVRTHSLAVIPKTANLNPKAKPQNSKSLHGTLLTGEMFAPILREQIEKLNALIGSRFHVLAVPNTYFGGDVAVAGLLTGQDFLAVKDKIIGEFAVVPKTVIKSDEPILLDGMKYDDLKAQLDVPIYDMDMQEFTGKILAEDF
jgi:NifB/MoaA-like Fe-S oxidoreductase